MSAVKSQKAGNDAGSVDKAVKPAEGAGAKTPSPWRAVIAAMVAMPFCCYWAQDQSADRIFSLMVPPLVLTMILVAANVVVRRFAPRLALSQPELLLFYGMQTVACAMASEWTDVITPAIYSYATAADTDRDTRTYIIPYLQHWLFFTDSHGLESFTNGGKTFGFFLSQLPIWWPKILIWTAIITLVCFAMLCINALMEKQWADRERLAFPLVQLPLAITENGGASPIWRSPVLWGVATTMFAIDMLNGFAYLYPNLPHISVRYLGDISVYLPSPPWNQIGWTPVGIFPFITAIGLLMPTDLVFSCLFFFFFRKAEQVVAAEFGYNTGLFGGGSFVPAPPYFTEQSWGAFIGLFVSVVLAARPYLKEIWHEVLHGSKPDVSRVPPRFALAGLVASLVGMGAIGAAAGLQFGFVLVYVGLFLIFSVAVTRLRAQVGAPTHEMANMGPNQFFVDFNGSAHVDTPTIVNTASLFLFMNRIHRTHPMPAQLEAMYMGDRSRMSAWSVFWALVLATVAGALIGSLACIYIGYHTVPQGGSTWLNIDAIPAIIQQPHGPSLPGIVAVFAGFFFVLILDLLRFNIIGFPLHPAGYALAMNFGLDYYWFGLLLALVAKGSTLRYVGLRGNENIRMVAFGLILGEFAAEAIWATFSMLNHDQITYSISINSKLNWQQ